MATALGVDGFMGDGAGGFNGIGQVASQMLVVNGNYNLMRPIAPDIDEETVMRQFAAGQPMMLGDGLLRKDEWEKYDAAVVRTAQEKFTFIQDLIGAGLVMPVENVMGVLGITWERISDMNDAQLDMSGEAEDLRDRLTYASDSIPIPLAHKGFKLNVRHLLASRKQGIPLDVEHAAAATRKVIELIEKTAIDGAFKTGVGNAGTLWGITTYPYRNTGSLSASWLSATGVQIFDDVNSMIDAAEGDNMDGPYRLYIPRNYAHKLRQDYSNSGSQVGKTIHKRLLEIDGLQEIKTNRFITGNNVVLVSMTSDTCEVIDGIRPTLVQWESKGGMVQEYKVLAIMPIRIKRDDADQCGIVHFSV